MANSRRARFKVLLGCAVLAVLLAGCTASFGGGSVASSKLESVVRQQDFGGAWSGEKYCTSIASGAVSGMGGELISVSWHAASTDLKRVVWTVACEAKYTIVTEGGLKTVTEDVLRFLVDTDQWHARLDSSSPGWGLAVTLGASEDWVALDPIEKP